MLSVPGVGTFSLQKKPAEVNFPDKIIFPPVYSFLLQEDNTLPSNEIYNWLSNALHISSEDAILRFNDFVNQMKKQLNEGDIIEWKGVGTISKGFAGSTIFYPSTKSSLIEKPVPANKVIREKSDHMVRVGEDEKTSEEMTDYFNRPVQRKSIWWSSALIIGIATTIFIGWYLSEKGISLSATANNTKLIPGETESSTYKTLP